ncbi:MAG: amino acid permease [Armatimonadota bacterium]
MLGRIWCLIVGTPLSSRRARHERLAVWLALPVLSADALSSSAYGPEEMKLILWQAGEPALRLAVPISIAIALLLFIVVFSYRQTVYAYPQGGGAFNVAHENLGAFWGLLAASALLIGYILTVTVSIAAGVNAVVSAFPMLLSYRVLLCVLCIALMTFINLRGIRESGAIFAPPTYGFILAFAILIGLGIVRRFSGDVEPQPYEPYIGTTTTLSWFVILTAFARGCSALTGVEAISNGVPALKEPVSHNAAKTLLWMAFILAGLVLGITYLSSYYHVLPRVNEHGEIVETLTSRMARTILEGTPFEWFYYVVQIATTAILILGANTAYADFPRLASVLANAGYAPRQLANLGDRLVFNNGILLLGILAALLVIYFRGDTHTLMPLYAVGVFLAFTMSQAGMTRRSLRLRPAHWQVSMLINGLGTVVTFLVFMTQLVVNFMDGAWISLVSIGMLIYLFYKVHGHYLGIREQLCPVATPPRPMKHKVLVLVPGVHQGVLKALDYARQLAPVEEIEALHINVDPRPPAIYRRVLKRGPDEAPELKLLTPMAEKLQKEWNTYVPDIPLKISDSEHRSLIEPIEDYIDELIEREQLDHLTVIVPELYPRKWWHHLLHNQSAWMVRLALMKKPKVVVSTVRYFLER